MTHVQAAEPVAFAAATRPRLSAEQLDVLASGVRLIALRALGDRDLADDVAQETMARALVAFERGGAEHIANPAAFVHGVARHVIADARRAHHRLEPLERANEPADPRADPLATAITAEESIRVRGALRKLAARDREILRLTFFDGLTVAALAARLGEPALRVRKRKSRALQRLRQAFFGHESADCPTTRSGIAANRPPTPHDAEDAE